jgi:hypothetical protein
VKDLLKSEVGGLRDVIRAEMEKNQSEMLHRFASLDNRMSRVESATGMNRG